MARCVVKRSRLNSALRIMVVPQRNVYFKIEICFLYATLGMNYKNKWRIFMLDGINVRFRSVF